LYHWGVDAGKIPRGNKNLYQIIFFFLLPFFGDPLIDHFSIEGSAPGSSLGGQLNSLDLITIQQKTFFFKFYL
jgi:hypothetical protein